LQLWRWMANWPSTQRIFTACIMHTWRLGWQPTSTKKSANTAQMRLHTSLQSTVLQGLSKFSTPILVQQEAPTCRAPLLTALNDSAAWRRSSGHLMRVMLKCAISTILVSEYTRGAPGARSSSRATAHSARTNSTIASLFSRSERTKMRFSSCSKIRGGCQPNLLLLKYISLHGIFGLSNCMKDVQACDD
jgi:hypothetical protein